MLGQATKVVKAVSVYCSHKFT